MEKVNTYNGDEEKIISHGNGLDPEEKIKYYEDVINDLYVVHGAFDRDKYMGENTLRKKLEHEIELAKHELKLEENLQDVVKIHTSLNISDLARIFESLKQTKLISDKTQITQIIRIFFSGKEQTSKEKQYSNRRSDTIAGEKSTDSSDIAIFIKKLLELSYKGKTETLEEIISHAQKLKQ